MSSMKLFGREAVHVPVTHASPEPHGIAQSVVGCTHVPLSRQVSPAAHQSGLHGTSTCAISSIVQSASELGDALVARATRAYATTRPEPSVASSTCMKAMTGAPPASSVSAL